MNVTIFIDGGSRGNPGPAAAGIVILNTDTNQPVLEAGYFLGRATNNFAEYQGLIRSLRAALDRGATHATIHSDSELMVRQVLGQYKVKSPDLQPLHREATALLRQLQQFKIGHVYRESNQRADQLVNAALDAQHDVVYT